MLSHILASAVLSVAKNRPTLRRDDTFMAMLHHDVDGGDLSKRRIQKQ
jgi:hypothetical protein